MWGWGAVVWGWDVSHVHICGYWLEFEDLGGGAGAVGGVRPVDCSATVVYKILAGPGKAEYY
jgi:hypothetical protein